MPEPGAAAATPAEAHRYPCEQCGADLRYQPGETVLVCDFCGHRQSVAPRERDRLAAMAELDLLAALAQDLPPALVEETRVLACPNCGAQVEFDPAVHSAECPFCATPVVADTGISRHIKPQAVLPFRVTEDAAREGLSRWLGQLWFAPNGVRQYARRGRRMTGVYVPFWTFDAATRSRYTGRRGDHYYETRTQRVNVNGKMQTRQVQVQKTRWTPVSGRVARDFDDVVILASRSLPRGYVDDLQPWDLTALEPYSPDYLAGFRAEAYIIELAEGRQLGRNVMDRVIASDVRRDIGGDVQQINSVSTEVSAETFKHILLPIWLAAYRFRGESYRFVVNGQTGEVQGERPWSRWKIALAVIAGLILAAGAAYLQYLREQGAF